MKRYHIKRVWDGCSCRMMPFVDGEYVLYNDVDATIKRLKDALVIYGVHLDDCEIKIVGGKCTCGYLNALKGKDGGK